MGHMISAFFCFVHAFMIFCSRLRDVGNKAVRWICKRTRVSSRRQHDLAHDLAHELAHEFAHELAHDLAHELAHDLAHELAHGLAHGLAQD